MAATSRSIVKRSSRASQPVIEPLEGRRLFSSGGDVTITETVLVSSAPNSNPQLINPWGISFGPTTPLWISENNSGQAQIYTAAGVKQGLTVSIPSADPNNPSNPTGQVFNGDATAFMVPSGTTTASAKFIFAGEDGGISAWAGGNKAVLEVNQFANASVFKGLAINTIFGQSFLYATDFRNAQVDVFDQNWKPVSMPGAFVDPRIPKDFAPFGIQSIGSDIFVTYAQQDAAKHDDIAGAGHGFVDEYDVVGTLLRRFDHVGALNSPWGMAQAPATGWGELSGDILVGQFGSGAIAAYRPNGQFDQVLRSVGGAPLVIDGLWGLTFGGGGANNGSTSTLFFTAGPDSESGGLFGSLTATVQPDQDHGHDHDGGDHDHDHDPDGDILDRLWADLGG